MVLITILLIVMMGMSVANEHTAGTIRLLLIRPKKRHKILSSKILCVWMYGVTLTAVCSVLLLIPTVILFGVGDLFVPDIFVVNGVARSIPAVWVFVAEVLLSLLGALLIVSVALFFSVVSKKATLAITFPLIMNSFLSVVQMLVLELIEYLPFLEFTVLPYIQPKVLLTTPISYYTYVSNFGYSYGQIASMSAVYGILIVALHVVGIGALSYRVFGRQQIKN